MKRPSILIAAVACALAVASAPTAADTALGTLGGTTSRAYGLNERTQIVGTARTATGTDRAFIWQDGVMTDLNDVIEADSGWTLTIAFGIDARGAIVGQGVHDGLRHAFFLEPQAGD